MHCPCQCRVKARFCCFLNGPLLDVLSLTHFLLLFSFLSMSSHAARLKWASIHRVQIVFLPGRLAALSSPEESERARERERENDSKEIVFPFLFDGYFVIRIVSI